MEAAVEVGEVAEAAEATEDVAVVEVWEKVDIGGEDDG